MYDHNSGNPLTDLLSKKRQTAEPNRDQILFKTSHDPKEGL